MVKYGTLAAGLHAPVKINAFQCAFRSATAMDEPEASASAAAVNKSSSNIQQQTQSTASAASRNSEQQESTAPAAAAAAPQQKQQLQQKQRKQLPPITLAAPKPVVVVAVSNSNPSATSSPARRPATTTTSSAAAASPVGSQAARGEMTNYNMDHLYCHPNEKSSPKVTMTTAMPQQQQQQQQHPSSQPPHRVQHLVSASSASTTTTTTSAASFAPTDSNNGTNTSTAAASTLQPDVSTVLREIKHLKEMLMLHLDLIQEQNDQLITRDKLVTALRKDNEMLRARFAKLLASTSGGGGTTIVGPRQAEKVCVIDVSADDSPPQTEERKTLSPASGSKSGGKGKATLQQPAGSVAAAQVPQGSPTVVSSAAGPTVPPSRISPLAASTTTAPPDTEMMEIELPVLNARHNILANISKKVINSCTKQLDTLTQLFAGGKPQAEAVYPASAATTQTPAPTTTSRTSPAAAATNTGKSSSTVTAAVSTTATTTTTTTTSTPPPPPVQMPPLTTTPPYTSIATVAPSIVSQTPLQNLTNAGDHIETVCIIEDDSDADGGRRMSPTADVSERRGGGDRVQDIEANVVDVDAEQPASDGGKTEQAKASRFQNSRRRRKRHDSIAVPRKRRRVQPQPPPPAPIQADQLEQPSATPPVVPVAPVAAAAANPQPHDDRHIASNVADAKPSDEPAPTDELPPAPRPPSGRRSFITTRQCYTTRQWYMDETAAEVDHQLAEFIELDSQQQPFAAAAAAVAAAAAAAAEAAAVELPRWTVRPHVASTDATGIEDFSAAAFQKRHARFELDEKKRKKWDIQRIREQRNVERLRRRLCRDEVVPDGPKGVEDLGTFYPPAENIRWVQVCDDLPVQAFGELVPAIPSAEFGLPWRADAAGQEGGSDQAPAASSLSLRSGERLHQLQQPALGASPAPNASVAMFGQSRHTAIVFAKKKVVRRQHYMAAVGAGLPVPPFVLSGVGAAAAASATSAAATRPSTTGAGSSGAHSRAGSGHSGTHSKRTGRKGKR